MALHDLVLKEDGGWTVAGLEIPPSNALTALLYAFRYHSSPKVKEESFWQIADILWNDGRLEPLCARHVWADETIKDCCNEKYVALGGAAGSGKSHTLAAFGIVQWLCAPADTLVLITSTSLTAARMRIWGSIEKLLDATEGLPFKLRSATGNAVYVNPNGTLVETAGLRLVAAEKSQTRDAIGKLIGMHNERVIFIADELSELSEAIVQAGLSNMSRNPYFQLLAASNPNSRFDAFGLWAEPAGGWDSVNPMVDLSWRTKFGGIFRRFDAERSPNLAFEDDEIPYAYLPTRSQIEEAKQNMGPESRGYMRMYRAVFFDSDEADGIYSEAELNRSGAMNDAELSKPVKVAALDPSFTNGGDDTILMFGEIGYDSSGQFVLRYTEHIQLYDDATDKSTPRTFQIVKQVVEHCKKRGINPYDFAMDATAAGNPFADVLASEWSPDFLRVQFGGAASDRPVSASKKVPAKHLFASRVSELWFCGKELVRCKQLKNIPNEVAKEMCLRQYDTIKGEHGLRMRAEAKLDYKRRNGHSPDHADAYFIMLDLARTRHSLLAVEPVKNDDGLANMRRNRTFGSLAAANCPADSYLD